MGPAHTFVEIRTWFLSASILVARRLNSSTAGSPALLRVIKTVRADFAVGPSTANAHPA